VVDRPDRERNAVEDAPSETPAAASAAALCVARVGTMSRSPGR
jgi:hypothetical protein